MDAGDSMVCCEGWKARLAPSSENVRLYDVIQLLYDFPLWLFIQMKPVFEMNCFPAWNNIDQENNEEIPQVKFNICIH